MLTKLKTSQFARFVIVGCTGFLVEALILTLVGSLRWSPIWGRVPGTMAAIAATYYLNRWITFGSSAAGRAQAGEIARYVAASTAGLAVNWIAYILFLKFLTPSVLLALVGATAISMVFNFVTYDLVVFRISTRDSR